MRIVVDLQACQSLPHRDRGIGRYSMALLKAMLRDAGDDEVWVALNGEIPDTIDPVRGALAGLIPDDRIVVWRSIRDTALEHPGNRWRHAASALAREAFLTELQPDVLHISSLFEGYVDDAVCTIGDGNPFITAVTLYDLIPLIRSDSYLGELGMREWYFRRLEELKRADLLLGISGHTCRTAMGRAGIPADHVVDISAAAESVFRPQKIDVEYGDDLLARLSIRRKFLLYPGGFDPRKNMEVLVRAYGLLAAPLRATCQLVIVCQASPEARSSLQNLAAACGLESDEVVLTGHVSDADLLALYNLCHALVFPSLEEGFGLPVLEAMSCGAAVVGSNASSIPEVIGCPAALFDPKQPESIAAKMSQVLTDQIFLESLRSHALQQSRRFSWERTAQAALTAMRATHAHRKSSRPRREAGAKGTTKPKMAYVSPLPPEHSGIADYSAELLPVLSEHYSIEVVSDQEFISDPWIRQHLPLRSTAWFDLHAAEYERVLYHFGNSLLHARMFPLLERHPGVVVLHDFFLSGIASHLEWANKFPGYWTRALYESHGYSALRARDTTLDQEKILEQYPCNLAVLRGADGVIVHSQFCRRLAEEWFGPGASRDWTVVPLLRVLPPPPDHTAARRNLDVADDELLICSFGVLGPHKRNREILEAWLSSTLFSKRCGKLVFVGGSHSESYGREMERVIADHGVADRVRITGWVPRQTYRDYLAAADFAVQLRRASRGEASAAVLDCFANRLPVIVNLHGPMTELSPDTALIIADEFQTAELAAAMERLAADAGLRHELTERASAYCRDTLDPHRIAALYREAIERAAVSGSHQKRARLARDIARIDADTDPSADDVLQLATGIAANQKHSTGVRQLLVDVSELVRRDSKSGIQRVVRSVLSALLAAPPRGYRVEPVCAEPGQRYRYARNFTRRFLDLTEELPADDPIDVHAGDIFVGLDLALDEIPINAAQFQDMRNRGTAVYFIVYDILPLTRADCFPPHAYRLFSDWLDALTRVADGVVCISKAVAEEVRVYLDALQPQRSRPFKLGWFHLGADIDSSLPTAGVTAEEEALLNKLESNESVLMVGTVEPRKAYPQALDAFDRLWADGSRLLLVIVGKAGWMSEATIERLRSHPEAGSRLFWFATASDELLERLYTRCSGLLLTSEGEGFGLPLVEAARHGLPILCRELPVFREIAGEQASYFSGFDASDLAAAIAGWRALQAGSHVPQPRERSWPSWEQSTRQLLEVLSGNWELDWKSGQRFWFPAYDRRLVVQNGRHERGCIFSTEKAGVVVQTWPVSHGGGSHRIIVLGEWLEKSGNAYIEIVAGDLTRSSVGLRFSASDEYPRGTLLDAETVLPRSSARIELRIATADGARLAIKGFGLEPMVPANP